MGYSRTGRPPEQALVKMRHAAQRLLCSSCAVRPGWPRQGVQRRWAGSFCVCGFFKLLVFFVLVFLAQSLFLVAPSGECSQEDGVQDARTAAPPSIALLPHPCRQAFQHVPVDLFLSNGGKACLAYQKVTQANLGRWHALRPEVEFRGGPVSETLAARMLAPDSFILQCIVCVVLYCSALQCIVLYCICSVLLYIYIDCLHGIALGASA